MRPFFLSVLAAVLVLTAAGGCQSRQAAVTGGKVEVVATFFPLYDFACQVGGERAHVTCLVPPGVSVHEWEPTPGDLTRVLAADMLLFNGAGLEPWIEGILPEIRGKVLVKATRGLTLSRFTSGHGTTEAHDDGHHYVYDPHAWVDPVNAQHYVKQVAAGLIKADPAGSAYYRQRAGDFIVRLQRLDGEYRAAAAGFKRKEIVTSHAAFGYLAARYGLEQIPVAGLSPQAEPSAARLKELVRLLREREIAYVFFEELASPRMAETLAREAGVKTLVLSPVVGATPEERAGTKGYVAVMEENLAALKKALGQGGVQ
ncbi:MAG: ABC transporter substrate-binding protein [Ammonifex sp.]|nr:MAG: ABC transporter substrate-binding protein [Ammonifex sp.]